MKHRTNEMIAGIVVIMGIALLCALLAVITDRIPWGGTVPFAVVFDDVRGLKKGDPVFFHGVPCGRVSSLGHEKRSWKDLWPEEPDAPHVKVVLRLDVDATIAPYLRTASKVTIEKTITGITAVVIREGTGEPVPTGCRIRGDSGAALEELAAEAQSVSASVRELIGDVRAVIGDIRRGDQLAATIDSIRATAANVEDTTAVIRDVATQSQDSLLRSVAAVRNTAEKIDAIATDLAPHTTELSNAIASAAYATDELASASTEIRSFLTRNRHRMDGTVRDVADAAGNVSEATGEIRRQPWRLLYRPSREECSTLGILDSVREYNLATATLERAFQELLVLKDQPELHVFSEKARKDAEAALARYREVESALWAELTR
jgi:ABC-type transporter Mla subunit MlaD